jgi:hypothetical protein
MGTHYLCDRHQKLLLDFIIVYFYSRNHLNDNVISNIGQELTNVINSIDTVSPGIETISNENTRLRSEHNQTKATYETIFPQMFETKKVSNELNEKVNKYGESHNDIERDLANTKKLYSVSKTPSLDTDGTVAFSFTKTADEMKSPFSIFSSTFKTSPFGYPFILRICSTIESANVNQAYLSIYITLLRGEFDPILFYPFPYNIYFCLCDQSGERKHIQSTLKPDQNLPSFACPTSERNPEIGIKNFCPLNYLTDAQSIYLKEGVFFIRVFIDLMKNGSNPFESIDETTNTNCT